MIRYRCPHCAALIVAHERRAGQSSVCKTCVKPHPIPADPVHWLTETGEPLHPPVVSLPAPVASPPAPEPVAVQEERAVVPDAFPERAAIPEELARPAIVAPEPLAPTAPEIQLPELIAEPVPVPVTSVLPPAPRPPVEREPAPIAREPDPRPVPPPAPVPGRQRPDAPRSEPDPQPARAPGRPRAFLAPCRRSARSERTRGTRTPRS
ncbi:hypothetical protein [Frigoriglobus tundricola]|uniref:Uncharacterized protein n=1 Tax=Frigoriglobus tundricola TaxID=2774151 RepID=A0A6M5YMD1_9BACT|nr:hypothetical protein [Frigoriglobus tundricola]QJW94754.1 hypothetical protein FTUN_2277 [Frigoriglobus tundricola]